MQAKARQHLQTLNQNLDQLLFDLEGYSHRQLNRKPAPDSWSATQCMHHLMLSEKLSMGYCQKKLSFDPKLKKAGLMSAARTRFICAYLRSPLKFKAPAFISGGALPDVSSLPEITEQWRAQRSELESFLQGLPEDIFTREVYKHPFGGRISLPGMLRFFQAHFDCHRRQLYRALS